MSGVLPTTYRDHLIGLGLALLYVGVLVQTAPELAMSRDESFYVSAAEGYARWFQMRIDFAEDAMTAEAVDAAWRENSEHPGLMKSLFALSWMAQQKWKLFAHDSTAHRFPAMVTAGLLLYVIYLFGAQSRGRTVGLFAALSYACLPRPFYHSHLNCFDVPITFWLTVTTYFYWRSLEKPWWSVLAGLFYGCSLGTKHNAWILPGVLLIHWTWFLVAELRARRRGAVRTSFVLQPWWLLSFATIGVGVFIGTWPWLWHDTLERVKGYAAFHLHHDYYNMAYFGVNYFRPPFPRSYPYVMIAFTVPAVTLALAFGAIVLRARVWLGAVSHEAQTSAEARPDRSATDILWIGALLAPLAPYMMPTTPIFGGTKHWFPSYPFLCLWAGVGAAFVFETLRARMAARALLTQRLAMVGVMALLLSPNVVQTAHSHGFGLSHYTPLAGGVPGAADHGMNRQFWGFTTGHLAPYFIRELPNGGSVWICDMTWGAWQMMQRDGLIPANIGVAGSIPSADYAIVHHEHHFAEVDFQAWVAYGSVRPEWVVLYDGVPIVSAYRNPRK